MLLRGCDKEGEARKVNKKGKQMKPPGKQSAAVYRRHPSPDCALLLTYSNVTSAGLTADVTNPACSANAIVDPSGVTNAEAIL